MGTIHLFRKPQRSFLGKLLQEFRLVAADRRSWKILLFGAVNVLCTGFLLMWCSSTNSIALTAYTYLTIFDLFSLITCLISYWVMMRKPSPVYSFGCCTREELFLCHKEALFHGRYFHGEVLHGPSDRDSQNVCCRHQGVKLAKCQSVFICCLINQ